MGVFQCQMNTNKMKSSFLYFAYEPSQHGMSVKPCGFSQPSMHKGQTDLKSSDVVAGFSVYSNSYENSHVWMYTAFNVMHYT
jgi:hypothetical protein